jgi:hypothetical protein
MDFDDDDVLGDASWQAQLERRDAWVSSSDIDALTNERMAGTFRDGDVESPQDQARRLLRDASPMAAATMIRLAQYAESESVRLRAAMEVLNRADQAGGSQDGREPWAAVYDSSAVERYANEGRDANGRKTDGK